MGRAMTDDDSAYFSRRAEAERKLADQATHANVAAAHHQLADAYHSRALSAFKQDEIEQRSA